MDRIDGARMSRPTVPESSETPEDWVDAVNPVLPGFFPDPSVCRVDDPEDGTWYYLVNSTFEYLPALPIHRSRDLVDWELVGHVFDEPGAVDLSTVGDSGGMLAPTIRHDGTRFLVVCTVVGGSRGGNGCFVVTANSAAGPWSSPVWWAVEGVDPSLLVDDDGRLWGHGTRLAARPEWPEQTEIWVREIDRETLLPVGEETVIWNGALRGAVWAEGPHLYRRDGWVYLLAAEGGSSAFHAVSVARAPSPTGPFEGYPGNPVLTHRSLGRHHPVTDIGRADLVDAPDGSSWALCLGSRPRGGNDRLGRETFLVDVAWEDGWPVFAPGRGRLLPDPGGPAPAVGGGPAGVLHVPEEVAVRRLPREFAHWNEDGTFRVAAGAALSADRPAFVARRLPSFDSEISIRIVETDAGVRAGLALRYSRRAYLSVTVGGGSVRIEGPDARNATLTARTPTASDRGTLVLRLLGPDAEVSWRPDCDECVTTVIIDVAHLCAQASGGFVGMTVGAIALGGLGSATFADLVLAPLRRGGSG